VVLWVLQEDEESTRLMGEPPPADAP
jgi:hypothetical protein